MGTTSTITWHCEKCGQKGKLHYDELLTNEHLYVNALKAHGLSFTDIEKPGVLEHLSAVKWRVRRRRLKVDAPLLPLDAPTARHVE